MSKPESVRSFMKPTITVCVTVAICVTILIAMRPDQSRSVQPLKAGYLYENTETKSSASDAPALQPDIAKRETKTTSVQKIAARTTPPLPEKDDVESAKSDAAVPELPVRASALGIDRAAIAAEASPWPRIVSDETLDPVLSYNISASDIGTLDKFVKKAFRQDFSDARALMADLEDPIARKFALWYYYRRKAPDTDAQDILAFLNDNPLWPGRDELEESFEDALFWREKSAEKIVAAFESRAPRTGAGKAALGIALIETGKKEEGTRLITDAWRLHPLTHAIEKRIRKLKVLNADDHRARAGYLLLQDNKRYVNAAKRVLPLIEKKWRNAVKAHIATVRRAKNAGTLLTRLDPKQKTDPAILFARIQWLRRAGNDEKARTLMLTAPDTVEKLIDPEEWWDERQLHIRAALSEGKLEAAYKMAKSGNAGLDHWDLSDAEFLAGWIAFRFRDKPEIARGHFAAAAAAGGLPKRRSRAAYWLGRVEAALGNPAKASAHFAEAAQYYHTFYGQLGRDMTSDTSPLALWTPPAPSSKDIDDFLALDVMKVMVIAEKAGFENLLSLFMYDLARQINSTPQMLLLCELASRLAPPHRTVRMAKIAINRDFPVEAYAYPQALPDFNIVADGQDVELALVHALSRQESEFNTNIVSSAGAVGLMQLLPSTAKLVARRHNVKYSKSKLTADPAYNVSLGSAFLNQLIRNYDGSYIMALAGYNAGPGRVRRWSREFGDPRKSDVDPIDWIERIPFSETRNYVHKVMESVQLYRSRQADERAVTRLAEDLHRGRTDKPVVMIGGVSN